MKKQTWVISIADNHGSFFYKGTEYDAEEMRRDKSNWEHAMGKKRLATEDEIKTKTIDDCWNHPNFNNKHTYVCECSKCKNIVYVNN